MANLLFSLAEATTAGTRIWKRTSENTYVCGDDNVMLTLVDCRFAGEGIGLDISYREQAPTGVYHAHKQINTHNKALTEGLTALMDAVIAAQQHAAPVAFTDKFEAIGYLLK
jgi:hypothetical protein